MAKKAASAATAAATPESVALRIVVEASQDTPTYYVNHIELSMGQHECAMWFARLPTKPSRAELAEATAAGEIVVDPEFQVIIPPTLIEGLISALQTVQAQRAELFPSNIEGKTE